MKMTLKTCQSRKTLVNCEIYMKELQVFPILPSLVQNVRRFANVLRNRVIA